MDTSLRTQPLEYCEVEKVFASFAQDAVDRFNASPVGGGAPELTMVKLGPLPHTLVEWRASLETPADAAGRQKVVAEVLRQRLPEVAAVVEVVPEADQITVTVHTVEAAHVGVCAVEGGKAQFQPLPPETESAR